MDATYTWKNFDLNTELHISANFIYSGLLSYRNLQGYTHSDEVFRVFYDLAVGMERLLKTAIILHSHTEEVNQSDFESALITHSHNKLSEMLSNAVDSYKPTSDQLRILGILSRFYKHYRYDRYILASAPDRLKEGAYFEDLIGGKNQQKIPATVRTFCLALYEIIKSGAAKNNMFTYEIRYNSKAYKLFLRQETDFLNEEIALKELILSIAHGESSSGLVEAARWIDGPLQFDSSDVDEYFDAFFDHGTRMSLIDLVEEQYNIEGIKPSKRIEMLKNLNSDLLCYAAADDEEE